MSENFKNTRKQRNFLSIDLGLLSAELAHKRLRHR